MDGISVMALCVLIVLVAQGLWIQYQKKGAGQAVSIGPRRREDSTAEPPGNVEDAFYHRLSFKCTTDSALAQRLARKEAIERLYICVAVPLNPELAIILKQLGARDASGGSMQKVYALDIPDYDTIAWVSHLCGVLGISC